MRDACDVTRTLSAETEKLCKVTWGFLNSRISWGRSFRRKISGLKWMFQKVLYVVTGSWTSLPIWRAINWGSGPAAWHPRAWIETDLRPDDPHASINEISPSKGAKRFDRRNSLQKATVSFLSFQVAFDRTIAGLFLSTVLPTILFYRSILSTNYYYYYAEWQITDYRTLGSTANLESLYFDLVLILNLN